MGDACHMNSTVEASTMHYFPHVFSSSFSEVSVTFEMCVPEMCRSDLAVVVNPSSNHHMVQT